MTFSFEGKAADPQAIHTATMAFIIIEILNYKIAQMQEKSILIRYSQKILSLLGE